MTDRVRGSTGAEDVPGPGSRAAGGQKVFLIGFSGTGKSHSGRLAARELSARFVDMDRAISQAAGKPIVDIFAEDGEEAFREMERQQLAQAASAPGSQVISTGGGVPCDARNRDVMNAAGLTIRLTAAPETLHQRLSRGGHPAGAQGGRSRTTIRPMLSEDVPLERIRELLAEREGAYAAAADATIDTEGRKPADVAAEIVGLARGATRSRQPRMEGF